MMNFWRSVTTPEASTLLDQLEIEPLWKVESRYMILKETAVGAMVSTARIV